MLIKIQCYFARNKGALLRLDTTAMHKIDMHQFSSHCALFLLVCRHDTHDSDIGYAFHTTTLMTAVVIIIWHVHRRQIVLFLADFSFSIDSPLYGLDSKRDSTSWLGTICGYCILSYNCTYFDFQKK